MSDDPGDSLIDRMIARADADVLPADHELRVRAQLLRDAVNNEDDAMKLLGAWARARRVWCAYTGEALV